MFSFLRKRENGQTALEYALVIVVVAVAIVFAARTIFTGDNGVGKQVFQKSINQISEGIDNAKVGE